VRLPSHEKPGLVLGSPVKVGMPSKRQREEACWVCGHFHDVRSARPLARQGSTSSEHAYTRVDTAIACSSRVSKGLLGMPRNRAFAVVSLSATSLRAERPCAGRLAAFLQALILAPSHSPDEG